MKTTILNLARLAVSLLAISLMASCATTSALNSGTRRVGTVTAIKECRADAHRAYIV